MKYFFYLSLLLLLICTSCNDSVLVGSELLGSESVDVAFKDDLALTAKTVLDDSTLMFRKVDSNTHPSNTYLVGQVEDAVFGKTETRSYFSPSIVRELPDFSGSPIDSVVMVLRLDSLGAYGDPLAIHDLSLSRLTERMDKDDRTEFYSILELPVEDTPIYTVTSGFNYTDSLTINEYVNDSLIQVEPQFRFKLDNQYWSNLLSSIDSLDESALLDMLPGFELRSEVSTNSMGGIDLGYNSTSSPSNIVIYYARGDTTNTTYTMPLGKYRHSYVSKDYNGSALMTDLTDDDAACLYLESQGGTNLIVDFSAISEVDDLILNYASLELTAKPFDETLYPAIEAIGAWYKDADDNLIRADRQDQTAILEESYPSGIQQWNYKLDITSYISQLRDGLIDNTELHIIALSKSEEANNVLIYGPNHTDNPLKLNLILTKP